MSDQGLKQRIMTRLFWRYQNAGTDDRQIAISDLARELREDPRNVTLVCERLMESGLLRGDDTMMDLVRLSPQGIEYCEGLVTLLS